MNLASRGAKARARVGRSAGRSEAPTIGREARESSGGRAGRHAAGRGTRPRQPGNPVGTASSTGAAVVRVARHCRTNRMPCRALPQTHNPPRAASRARKVASANADKGLAGLTFGLGPRRHEATKKAKAGRSGGNLGGQLGGQTFLSVTRDRRAASTENPLNASRTSNRVRRFRSEWLQSLVANRWLVANRSIGADAGRTAFDVRDTFSGLSFEAAVPSRVTDKNVCPPGFPPDPRAFACFVASWSQAERSVT